MKFLADNSSEFTSTHSSYLTISALCNQEEESCPPEFSQVLNKSQVGRNAHIAGKSKYILRLYSLGWDSIGERHEERRKEGGRGTIGPPLLDRKTHTHTCSHTCTLSIHTPSSLSKHKNTLYQTDLNTDCSSLVPLRAKCNANHSWSRNSQLLHTQISPLRRTECTCNALICVSAKFTRSFSHKDTYTYPFQDPWVKWNNFVFNLSLFQRQLQILFNSTKTLTNQT